MTLSDETAWITPWIVEHLLNEISVAQFDAKGCQWPDGTKKLHLPYIFLCQFIYHFTSFTSHICRDKFELRFSCSICSDWMEPVSFLHMLGSSISLFISFRFYLQGQIWAPLQPYTWTKVQFVSNFWMERRRCTPLHIHLLSFIFLSIYRDKLGVLKNR